MRGWPLVTACAAQSAQPVQTQAEALADDATQYAAQFGVSPDEALRRLKAQQASVAATDAIAREFADRLAGISIEHSPGLSDRRAADRRRAGRRPQRRTACRSSSGPAPRRPTPRRSRRCASTSSTCAPTCPMRAAPATTSAPARSCCWSPAPMPTASASTRSAPAPSRSAASRCAWSINELNESNMSVDGGGRVEGLNLADQAPQPLHDGLRRHQRRDQRDHHRRALPGRAHLRRPRRQQRHPADDRIVGRGLPRRADQRQPQFARAVVLLQPRRRARCGAWSAGAMSRARAPATSSAIMAKARATAARRSS